MHKPTILLVDDNLTTCAVIKGLLQDELITLVFAHTGLEALTAVEDTLPALILLDVQLARTMNGLHVCQLLRRHAVYRDIPIVMLTAKRSSFDRMYGRLVGASDYVTKPIDPQVLLALVQKYLATWHEAVYHHDMQPFHHTRANAHKRILNICTRSL